VWHWQESLSASTIGQHHFTHMYWFVFIFQWLDRDLFDGMHERNRSTGRSSRCRSFVLSFFLTNIELAAETLCYSVFLCGKYFVPTCCHLYNIYVFTIVYTIFCAYLLSFMQPRHIGPLPRSFDWNYPHLETQCILYVFLSYFILSCWFVVTLVYSLSPSIYMWCFILLCAVHTETSLLLYIQLSRNVSGTKKS
jgi:hypothetical protein